MQAKTIKKILKNKVESWVGSIKDEALQKLVERDVVVTGGSIVSLLLKEDVNDYDLYFKTKETVKALAEYYVNQQGKSKDFMKVLDGATDAFGCPERIDSDDHTNIKEIVRSSLDLDRIKIFIYSGFFRPDVSHGGNLPADLYDVVFISPNAVSLTNNIQLVLRFWGTPEEIHTNYDFIHATNYYDYKEDNLVLPQAALESIITKQLKYNGSKYPVTSIIRSKKFIKRGWNISAGEYLKMCFQVSQLDLTNLITLEDQLIGVDIAYFSKLIEIIRSSVEKDSDFKPSLHWLSTILDRLSNGEELDQDS